MKFFKNIPIHKKIFRSLSTASNNEVNIQLSGNKSMTISWGKLAQLADGSAVSTIGNTSILVTAVSKKPKSAYQNFLPLIVDYRHKSAAAARIPTNFLRRDLAPTEREILISRMVDRSIRPLFPDDFKYDTQITCNMLALDGTNLPDIVSINATSACLTLSDIPWNGPIGAVRVGLNTNGDILINPDRKELDNSQLNLIVTATKNKLIVMLEGNANNVSQKDLEKALKFGVNEAQKIIQTIEDLQKHFGKRKRNIKEDLDFNFDVTVPTETDNIEEINSAIKSLSEMRLKEIFQNFTHDKLSRDEAINDLRDQVFKNIKNNFSNISNLSEVIDMFNKLSKQVFRELILETRIRCDGRKLNQLRPIDCQVDMYKPLHGSSLFQRGQTKVFCTVTLDSHESALKLDPLSMLTMGIKEKNFFTHYNFPPFATKEIGNVGSAGRREVGHGALAEKGLAPIVPNNFPFTIRLTSDVLESNGSSSMASVCGGSLALMDAGIPISMPAAGVAIGLITKYNQNKISEYAVLTDILGIEDYMGDMDFKIAGTSSGITSLQADIKIPGVPLSIIFESIERSTEARGKILEIMNECMPESRQEKKDNWPVYEKLEIEPHQRSKLFGVGGINLKKLMLEQGVYVTQINEKTYEIFAPNKEIMIEVKDIIEKLLNTAREPELEFGAIYTVKILEFREFGVMVEIHPTMPPILLHNSQLDQRKISHPSVLGFKEGDELKVKYFGRDPASGQIRLSRKVLQALASPAKKL